MRKKPVMLMILDGWGIPNGSPGCALSAAELPNFRRLWQQNLHTQLTPSGEAVGLPAGQMGNSEVGHLNIGAGRIVYQELTRISRAIQTGELKRNPVLLQALNAAKEAGRDVHFMGLLSDGGVHSHQEHLYALLEMAKEVGVSQAYIHCFLDGRDVPPTSGADYLRQLQQVLDRLQYGKIASVVGRYYAMDRDQRWERIQQAWQGIALGQGLMASDAVQAVVASYQQEVTDEFVKPIVISEQGQPAATVKDGDALIFFNFRADRAREITRAFVDHDFKGFERNVTPKLHFVCMTCYDVTIEAPVAFPNEDLTHTLGEELAQQDVYKRQILDGTVQEIIAMAGSNQVLCDEEELRRLGVTVVSGAFCSMTDPHCHDEDALARLFQKEFRSWYEEKRSGVEN